MQDRYCGDAGDFGKFILLNALATNTSAPTLGVNWYYVPLEKRECGDGNHVAYLEKGAKGEGQFRKYCPEIYDQLRDIVHRGPRCVAEIERRTILPDSTLFFSEALPDPHLRPAERAAQRRAWHARAMSALMEADLIFLDPDNGINPESVTASSRYAMKYAFRDEIGELFCSGTTVVVYNHRDRSPAEKYARKIRNLGACLGPGDVMRVLRFRRFSVRDYVFLVQKEHREMVDEVIDRLAGEHCAALFTRSVPHLQ